VVNAAGLLSPTNATAEKKGRTEAAGVAIVNVGMSTDLARKGRANQDGTRDRVESPDRVRDGQDGRKAYEFGNPSTRPPVPLPGFGVDEGHREGKQARVVVHSLLETSESSWQHEIIGIGEEDSLRLYMLQPEVTGVAQWYSLRGSDYAHAVEPGQLHV
jgi:hypothetical protein